jgi:hypothetical protein
VSEEQALQVALEAQRSARKRPRKPRRTTRWRLPRAVLDANVYVSAIIQPAGTPGQFIGRFLRGASFELVLSPAVLDEVLRAL